MCADCKVPLVAQLASEKEKAANHLVILKERRKENEKEIYKKSAYSGSGF
jgi:hypothetical protein